MHKNKATLFFDESGFTGPNLMNEDQKYFCYASVEYNHQEAEKLVNYIIEKYRIQNGEIKGSNLVKRAKGKSALDEIIQTLDGRVKVSISDKKFALACKFFEYIFEPAIKEINSLLYRINFHKFVSNLLYLKFLAKNETAEQLFFDFEEFMRSGNVEGLSTLFKSSNGENLSQTLSYVVDFAINNQNLVLKELDGYIGHQPGKWILDLTTTSLFSLLAEWGQEFGEIEAYCDESKPIYDDLNHEKSIFDSMINRSDKLYSNFGEIYAPISFNLSKRLELVESHSHPGIQLADAIATAFTYACNIQNQDHFALKWRTLVEQAAIYASVFPDPNYVDITKLPVQRNILLLHELTERSKQGVNLIDGIVNFLDETTYLLSDSSNPLLDAF